MIDLDDDDVLLPESTKRYSGWCVNGLKGKYMND